MESELPTLLYLFFFALAVPALVLMCRSNGLKHAIQIPVCSRSDRNSSQNKS